MQSHADRRAEKCIHHVFEDKANANPESIAAVFENQHLTYRELNDRSNQLARYLIRQGVQVQSRVGIFVDRSLDMIVGLLAILKAGAAYVPLDPAYPKERLMAILQDANVSALLAGDELVGSSDLEASVLIRFRQHAAAINEESQENVVVQVTPADLAYVIYTSGSTGNPKGVQIEHRTVINLIEATKPLLHLSANDVWSQFHSYAFDLSVWEIFGCLLTGARLVIVPRRLLQAPGEFCELLIRERVTILNQTPSAARQLIYACRRNENPTGINSTIRAVICGGEALPGTVARQLLEWQVALWNFYGPTEATVWVTALRVEPTHCDEAAVPIGRPFANVQTYVLDDQAQLVSSGVAGELYVGGDCLARGYLNRPELTAAKFVSIAQSKDREERLYKTGDWARVRSDGNLEFLGRIDQQVKVNGFRVELGEIEKALESHPATRESVVSLRQDSDGTGQLVAYLTGATSPRPTTHDLRSFLMRKLPEYMVPSAFVWLDALPLTPNGKVDRAALPMPAQFGLPAGRTVTAPIDAIQRQLTRIWEKVLRVHPVGIHDNFFDIGGHSLLAVRLFTELHEECGTDLPLATLVRHPTIAQLATAIRAKDTGAASSCLVLLQDKGAGLPFFCVHAVGGNILNYIELSRRLGEHRPFYALQAQGLDPRKEPHRQIEEMAAHYLREIRAVQPNGPYLIAGESFGGIVAYEMAQQLAQQGEEAALLVLLDTTPEAEPLRAVHRKIGRRLQLLARLRSDERMAYLKTELRNLPDAVKGRLRRYGLYAPSAKKAKLSGLFDRIRQINGEAHERYQLRPYGGRTLLFRARESPWSGDLGWRKLVTGELIIHEVPGAHGTFINEPHVRHLAEKLRLELWDAEARASAERPKDQRSGRNGSGTTVNAAARIVVGVSTLLNLADLMPLLS